MWGRVRVKLLLDGVGLLKEGPALLARVHVFGKKARLGRIWIEPMLDEMATEFFHIDLRCLKAWGRSGLSCAPRRGGFGLAGKVFTKRLSGTKEENFDMTAAQLHDPCNFGEVEFLLNAQPENFAGSRVEVFPNPTPNLIEVFFFSQHHRRISGESRRRFGAKLFLRSLAASSLPKKVDALPPCDGKNPGRKAIFRIKAVKALVGLNEGALGHVFRVHPTTYLLLQESENAGLITFHEGFEGMKSSFFAQGHELFIGIFHGSEGRRLCYSGLVVFLGSWPNKGPKAFKN